MTSLSPLATRVGALMLASRASLAKSRTPHSMMAAACASRAARPGRGVAALGSSEDPAYELLALGLARLRRGEEEVQDVLRSLHVLHRVSAGFVGPAVHLPTTLGSRSRQDHSARELRALKSDLLRDETADREAEEVDLGKGQRVYEGQRVATVLLERRRNCAAGQAHPARVEEENLMLSRQVVDQGRIPVVEVAPEVLEEDDRNGAGLPEPAVRVRRPVGPVDGQVGRGVLGDRHWPSPSLTTTRWAVPLSSSVRAARKGDLELRWPCRSRTKGIRSLMAVLLFGPRRSSAWNLTVAGRTWPRARRRPWSVPFHAAENAPHGSHGSG